MKTEELIRALAADASRPVVSIDQALLRALGLGVAVSIALFLLLLHPRTDVAEAMVGLPFYFKLAFALSVAVAPSLFLTQAARPMSPQRRRWPLILAPLLLVAGVLIELISAPAEAWATHLIGRNAPHCLSLIPLLSLPPLVCLFAALRH